MKYLVVIAVALLAQSHAYRVMPNPDGTFPEPQLNPPPPQLGFPGSLNTNIDSFTTPSGQIHFNIYQNGPGSSSDVSSSTIDELRGLIYVLQADLQLVQQRQGENSYKIFELKQENEKLKSKVNDLENKRNSTVGESTDAKPLIPSSGPVPNIPNSSPQMPAVVTAQQMQGMDPRIFQR